MLPPGKQLTKFGLFSGWHRNFRAPAGGGTGSGAAPLVAMPKEENAWCWRLSLSLSVRGSPAMRARHLESLTRLRGLHMRWFALRMIAWPKSIFRG
jgi:hypothetical protein